MSLIIIKASIVSSVQSCNQNECMIIFIRVLLIVLSCPLCRTNKSVRQAGQDKKVGLCSPLLSVQVFHLKDQCQRMNSTEHSPDLILLKDVGRMIKSSDDLSKYSIVHLQLMSKLTRFSTSDLLLV